MPSYEETPQAIYATYMFCILWIYGWFGLCILAGILTLIDKIKKREYKWKKKKK